MHNVYWKKIIIYLLGQTDSQSQTEVININRGYIFSNLQHVLNIS